MRCIESFKKLEQAMLAVGFGLLLSAVAQADIIISEVAPWSSGNSPVGADWFELTNTGAAAVDITGWRVDDGPSLFAASLPLTGITSIAPGESVIFLETDDDDEAPEPATFVANFKSNWFGAFPPAGLQVGTYEGSGIGLSTGGDGVNIFNSGGTHIWGVSFGDSPENAPFGTFDNTVGLSGLITQLSLVGVNGAFVAAGNSEEIGSPGTAIPEPATAALFVAAVGALAAFKRRRPGR